MIRRQARTHPLPRLIEDGKSRALRFDQYVVQSSMRKSDPHCLDLEYTRMMMAFLLFNPTPRRIGMIGLGGGSLVKFCHRHLPQAKLWVAEINPLVLGFRQMFDVPADSDRLSVMLIDGADFVREYRELDVLLVDGYDDGGLPENLCTPGFFRNCRQALAPAGIAMFNLLPQSSCHDWHCAAIDKAFGNSRAFTEPDGYNTAIAAFRGSPQELKAFPVPADWAGAGELHATLQRLGTSPP